MPWKSSSPNWALHSCADLELTPEVQDDHASYIASWLQVLKNDHRAIFRAATHAQSAVNYLHSLQPERHGVAAA
jgi:antirestriction protein ArdC